MLRYQNVRLIRFCHGSVWKYLASPIVMADYTFGISGPWYFTGVIIAAGSDNMLAQT